MNINWVEDKEFISINILKSFVYISWLWNDAGDNTGWDLKNGSLRYYGMLKD